MEGGGFEALYLDLSSAKILTNGRTGIVAITGPCFCEKSPKIDSSVYFSF